MNFHPLSELFPLMEGREFDELVADIKANGLREPIWTYQGQILDGRNRWRACEKAGIAQRPMREYTGDDPLGFVVSLNLHRRHLTEGQKAALALELLPHLEEQARKRLATSTGGSNPRPVEFFPQAEKGKARDQAAKLVGTNPRYVSDAKKLAKEAPELFAQVKAGEMSIPEARKIVRKERQKERYEDAVKAAAGREGDGVTITDSQAVVPCDALITDPPYGILDEPWEPSELEAFTRGWAERWNECGAKCVLIFWSQRYLWEGRQWLGESLADYEFQQLLVWHYPNNKSPQSRRGFKQTWEPVYFYRRRDADFSVCVSGDAWGDGLNDFDCHVAAVPQSNFNDADRKVHPAQKPVAVFRWLINAVSQPGDLICDPFAGSGTSGIAAVQLGRRYHGIEIDPEFLRLARERVLAYGTTGLRAA